VTGAARPERGAVLELRELLDEIDALASEGDRTRYDEDRRSFDRLSSGLIGRRSGRPALLLGGHGIASSRSITRVPQPSASVTKAARVTSSNDDGFDAWR